MPTPPSSSRPCSEDRVKRGPVAGPVPARRGRGLSSASNTLAIADPPACRGGSKDRVLSGSLACHCFKPGAGPCPLVEVIRRPAFAPWTRRSRPCGRCPGKHRETDHNRLRRDKPRGSSSTGIPYAYLVRVRWGVFRAWPVGTAEDIGCRPRRCRSEPPDGPASNWPDSSVSMVWHAGNVWSSPDGPCRSSYMHPRRPVCAKLVAARPNLGRRLGQGFYMYPPRAALSDQAVRAPQSTVSGVEFSEHAPAPSPA